MTQWRRVFPLPEIGTRYGRLEVIAAPVKVGPVWKVECRCDCGTVRFFRCPSLRVGTSQTCGCSVKDTGIRSRKSIDQAARDLAARTTEQDNGCWLVSGSDNGRGYGLIRVGGRKVYTHRLAWQLANGPIPKGMEVCHKCDTPKCVNPSHLFLGTHRDNMRDMYAKRPEMLTRLAIDGRKGLAARRAKLRAAKVGWFHLQTED